MKSVPRAVATGSDALDALVSPENKPGRYRSRY
jgi:hypothetical protein